MPIRIRVEGGSGGKSILALRQLADENWRLIESYLPIGEYGPHPERLRDQLEEVIRRFRSGAQRREIPGEFGPWSTVYGRFRVWRNAGVFTSLLEGLIAEAARQGKTDLSLVSMDSRPPMPILGFRRFR
ncbi:hypothetical protein GCM10027073_11940 [Streptomyces chlorus]